MLELTQLSPMLLDPAELEAASAAFCCRCGEPNAEATRLATLREMLDSSRVLSRSLEAFTKAATTHFQGVHCTADMRGDVTSLSHAFAQWTEAVASASQAYHDWHEQCAGDDRGERRVASASMMQPPAHFAGGPIMGAPSA